MITERIYKIQRKAILICTIVIFIFTILFVPRVFKGNTIISSCFTDKEYVLLEIKTDMDADAKKLSIKALQETINLKNIVSQKVASVLEATEEENYMVNNDEILCAWSGITISVADFDLICTTVYCEAGNQSIETQIMVALTILNRLSAEGYPNTVKEVIYQDKQYSVTEWTGFEQYGWTSSVEQAVTYSLEVNEHPEDMYFFRTEHYHKFGHPYRVSDDLYFSTLN